MNPYLEWAAQIIYARNSKCDLQRYLHHSKHVFAQMCGRVARNTQRVLPLALDKQACEELRKHHSLIQ